MTTTNNDDVDRLLRQNQQAAADIELDTPLQLEPEGLSGFVRTQVEINKVLVERLDGVDKKVERILDDVGNIKGKHAQYEVARNVKVITVDLGLEFIREIERDELAKWAQELSRQGTPTPTVHSFRKADIVIEASADEGVVYIAVEVSYTGDQRDTDRAIRNADLLHQLTECRAKPVVASVKNDHHVNELVKQGLVHWHQIDEDALRAY